MQVSTVHVKLKNNKEYDVASIYCPPRYNLLNENYTTLFKSLGNNFIIGGDFNAKHTYWGSRITSPKGRELYEAGKSNNCEFHSAGKPTYWPADTMKLPDIIDFFITKGICDNFLHLENSEELSSDHSPVIMTISATIVKKDNLPKLTNNKTDWVMFGHLVEANINLQVPIKTPLQLEDELAIINNVIQQAAWDSTPVHQGETQTAISYPLEVRELVRQKRRARKAWQRNRTPK